MKKISLLIILLSIFIIGAGCVSAAELDNSTSLKGTDQIDEIQNENIESDVLEITQKPGTLAELNQTINSNDDNTIYLTKDYKYEYPDWKKDYSGDFRFYDGIVINRALTIYGNGHTIDGDNSSRLFNIKHTWVIFHDIIFKSGFSYWDGGAIYTDNPYEINYTAINCTFKDNMAEWGGAMLGGYAINSTFINNYANRDGGAILDGKATNCTFKNNRASCGGAMAASCSCHWNFIPMIAAENCVFENNTALHYGRAVYDICAKNCIFNENEASFCGGAMYCTSLAYGLAASNSTFSNNYAKENGGAIYIKGGNWYRELGNKNYYVLVENCEFKDNAAKENGGAIFTEDKAEDSKIKNCIFENNPDHYDKELINKYRELWKKAQEKAKEELENKRILPIIKETDKKLPLVVNH